MSKAVIQSVESLVLRVFTRFYNSVGKRARATLPMIVCAGLFCYFSIHFAGGDHGLEARDRLKLRVAQLETSLEEISRERSYYEGRIQMVNAGSVSPDLADELARKFLQYAHPDDLVLFE